MIFFAISTLLFYNQCFYFYRSESSETGFLTLGMPACVCLAITSPLFVRWFGEQSVIVCDKAITNLLGIQELSEPFLDVLPVVYFTLLSTDGVYEEK